MADRAINVGGAGSASGGAGSIARIEPTLTLTVHDLKAIENRYYLKSGDFRWTLNEYADFRAAAELIVTSGNVAPVQSIILRKYAEKNGTNGDVTQSMALSGISANDWMTAFYPIAQRQGAELNDLNHRHRIQLENLQNSQKLQLEHLQKSQKLQLEHLRMAHQTETYNASQQASFANANRRTGPVAAAGERPVPGAGGNTSSGANPHQSLGRKGHQ